METKTPSILIGMPSASGLIPSQMVQSLLQLRKPGNVGFMLVERQQTEKARSAIAIEALRQGFDYLLFIDDDNPIPPDTLELMLADDKDIVIAPIPARNPEPGTQNHKLCAYYMTEMMIKDAPLRMYHPITEFRDPAPLHRIDGGGTGCMLIKRKVLDAVYQKYKELIFERGDITVNGQRRTMSEDMEFCERATDAGFEIWLDDRVRPIHLTGYRAVQWTPPEPSKE